MTSFFYDVKEQFESRGRITIENGVIADIVMMKGKSDTNGKNIEFLGKVISELIRVVNKQNVEILELKNQLKQE